MRGETHHFMALIEYLFHLTFLKTFVRDKNLQCAQRIRASQWKPLIHLLLLLSIVTIFGEFTVTYRMTLKQLERNVSRFTISRAAVKKEYYRGKKTL